MFKTETNILKNKKLTILSYQSEYPTNENHAFLNCHAFIKSRWSRNILAAKKTLFQSLTV